MDKVIREHIIEFGKKRAKGEYKPGTIKVYVSNIVAFNKVVNGKEDPFDDLDWSRDYDNVFAKLEQVKNLQTRRNYLNSLIIAQQTMGFKSDITSKYITLREVYKHQYEKAGSLTPSQKEVMDAVKKEDILKHLADFTTGHNSLNIAKDHSDYQMFAVMDIHTRYPFRNELADMKVIRRVLFDKMSKEDKSKTNWYILENGWSKATFVMAKYKTDKMYGFRELAVDERTSKIIHKLFQMRGTTLKDVNNKPILCWSNGNPITRNQLSAKLTEYTLKHFGHRFSTTLLAKYFSKPLPEKITKETVDELEKDAKARGHSVKTKLDTYTQ
jgi:hypothetical protein